ncbi:MAG: hypothetical protein R6V05_06300, partial [Candidatus Brocadiia bacterium]
AKGPATQSLGLWEEASTPLSSGVFYRTGVDTATTPAGPAGCFNAWAIRLPCRLPVDYVLTIRHEPV